jgi:hypothetical protein
LGLYGPGRLSALRNRLIPKHLYANSGIFGATH